jgi:hypothetical protein
MSPALGSSTTVYLPRQDLDFIYFYPPTNDTCFGFGTPFMAIEGYDVVLIDFDTDFADYEYMAFASGFQLTGAAGLVVSRPRIIAARANEPAFAIIETLGQVGILSLFLTNPVLQVATRTVSVYGLPDYQDWK